MLSEGTAIISHEDGLHARVAAMIVQKAYEIRTKYDCKLFIRLASGAQVEIRNLMLLVSMKITKGDKVWISAEGATAEVAVQEMLSFLKSDFTVNNWQILKEVDKLLQENDFTVKEVFSNIANGLIVTNEDDIIIIYNNKAADLLGVPIEKAIGKNVVDVVPNTRLHIIRQTGVAEKNSKQIIGKAVTMANRTPIIINGKIRGAIAIFDDISAIEKITDELYAVKELKERLQLILATVQDGICMLDKNGEIIYVNPSYLKIVEENSAAVLGKNIYEISPNGLRATVLKTGQPQIASITKKSNGVTVVANVNPLIIDGEIAGVLSVVKNITELQSVMDKLNSMKAKAAYLEDELFRTKKSDKAFNTYIGSSGVVRDVLAMAMKAAKSNATVLIRGESGTGKELIAQGIHNASFRAKGPFIRVNCGAIPESLLESELFGYEKGAFTGAVKKKMGRFELAHNGTIFLDEIGDMDKSMQVKLLRVLQQKEFERVGGEETIKVDVRIIAATNRNLEQMLKDDLFREDLYYRLNVIPLFLPSLRERIADLGVLVQHFIDKYNKEMAKKIKGIKNDALEVLTAYKWPGNVRELENIIERMVTLLEGDYIEVSNLPAYINKTLLSEDKLLGKDVVLPWEVYEQQIIQHALNKCGSYNGAAKALGLTHKTVASKVKKYNIEKHTS